MRSGLFSGALIECLNGVSTRDSYREKSSHRKHLWFAGFLFLVLPPSVAFAQAPSVPGNVRVAVYSSNSAELLWDRATDNGVVVGYEVAIDGRPLGLIDALSVYSNTYLPGQNYTYTLRSVDNEGNVSDQVSVSFIGGQRGLSTARNIAAIAPPIPEPEPEPEPEAAADAEEPISSGAEQEYPPENLRASIYSSRSFELMWDRADGQNFQYQVVIDGNTVDQTNGLSSYFSGQTRGAVIPLVVTTISTSGERLGSAGIEVDLTNRSFTGSNGIENNNPDSNIGAIRPELVLTEQTDSDTAQIDPPANLRAAIYSSGSFELMWDRAEGKNYQYVVSANGNTVDLTNGLSSYFSGQSRGSVIPLMVTTISASGNQLGSSSIEVDLANRTFTSNSSGAGSSPASDSNAVSGVNNPDNIDADSVTSEVPASAGDTDAGDGTVEMQPGGTTPPERSSLGNPPVLDPNIAAIPSPNSSDPFGSLLEIDDQVAVAGSAPTTPKNLRIELISNDWAEINWAPSNDDGIVVAYRVYRSDGVIYNIVDGASDPSQGAVNENQKYFNTTSFIDCNYTRFALTLHACSINTPEPGDTFSYQVTAIDEQGNESPRSNSITVTYHLAANAPVPLYNDFFKNGNDTFAQDHDLSETQFFLDKFEQVFSDEFDGDQIDSSKWNTSLTWGDTRIINSEQQLFVNTQANPGFGYDPFNMNPDRGTLIIEAVQTPDAFIKNLPSVCFEEHPGNNGPCEFLSGALSSHDRFGVTYGYFESRMRVAATPGTLSTFYLFHRFPGRGNQAHAPEIDVVEYLGENPFGDEVAFQTYHYDDVIDGTVKSSPTMYEDQEEASDRLDEDFHTFSVLWEPQLIIWYIDGKEIKRISGVQVARRQMNLVTYLVAGSAWAPTPADDPSIYPLQLEIDYIRAYQRPEYIGNGVYPDQ